MLAKGVGWTVNKRTATCVIPFLGAQSDTAVTLTYLVVIFTILIRGLNIGRVFRHRTFSANIKSLAAEPCRQDDISCNVQDQYGQAFKADIGGAAALPVKKAEKQNQVQENGKGGKKILRTAEDCAVV